MGTMSTLIFSRQADMIPFQKIAEWRFLILGVGATGSNIACTIARMGAQRITLVDPDTVQAHNVPPGFFVLDNVGFAKALAVASLLSVDLDLVLSESHIHAMDIRADSRLSWQGDVVFCCVDSNVTQMNLFRSPRIKARYWFSTRMGGPAGSVYFVDRETEWGLDRFLRSFDQEPPPLACGMKATAFITAGIIPGFVGSILYNVLNGHLPPYAIYWNAEAGFCTIEPGPESRLHERR